jgi:hypothetical protein
MVEYSDRQMLIEKELPALIDDKGGFEVDTCNPFRALLKDKEQPP